MHVHPPKPLHGWRAFFGEVGIVVLGILIALALEQVVEALHWRDKVGHATAMLREDVAVLAMAAQEQNVSAPCVAAQIAAIQARLAPSAAFRPLPLYSSPGFPSFVLRRPTRQWDDGVWRVVTGEGVSTHLPDDLALDLRRTYDAALLERETSRAADTLTWRLNSLSQPGATDGQGRGDAMQNLAELQGRQSLLTLVAAQMLAHVKSAGMMPAPDRTRAFLYGQSGTVRFCREHHLPLGDPNAPQG